MRYTKTNSNSLLFTTLILLMIGCNKDNSLPPSNFQIFEIGSYFSGGVIGYIFNPGDQGYVEGETHGLIVAPKVLGPAPWGCIGKSISGTRYDVGKGLESTNAIIAGCSEKGIGARLCKDCNISGYRTWYLPTLDDLQKIRNNISKVDSALAANGGQVLFTTQTYLSSTQVLGQGEQEQAWGFNFYYNYFERIGKDEKLFVRAVKSF
jgi:hypothetical protein